MSVIVCPCGYQIHDATARAGERRRCPACGLDFIIPVTGFSSSSRPAAESSPSPPWQVHVPAKGLRSASPALADGDARLPGAPSSWWSQWKWFVIIIVLSHVIVATWAFFVGRAGQGSENRKSPADALADRSRPDKPDGGGSTTPAEKAGSTAKPAEPSRKRPLPAPEQRFCFRGHDLIVHAVAFSPDGKQALSGSLDTTLRLWDLVKYRELRKFATPAGPVSCVAFSPSGKQALYGGKDPVVRLWDVEGWKEIRGLSGHKGPIQSVAFSADGKYALSGSDDQTANFWNLADGKVVCRLSGHEGPVKSVALSRDGKQALTGSLDGSIRVWNLPGGEPARAPLEVRNVDGGPAPVYSVAFSPDGTQALSGDMDSTVRLWNLVSGSERQKLTEHKLTVTSVAFSPDGKRALTGSWDKTVRLWDLEKGEELLILTGHSCFVWSVAFSPDGKLAISSSGAEIKPGARPEDDRWVPGNDNTIRLWTLPEL